MTDDNLENESDEKVREIYVRRVNRQSTHSPNENSGRQDYTGPYGNKRYRVHCRANFCNNIETVNLSTKNGHFIQPFRLYQGYWQYQAEIDT